MTDNGDAALDELAALGVLTWGETEEGLVAVKLGTPPDTPAEMAAIFASMSPRAQRVFNRILDLAFERAVAKVNRQIWS